MVKSFVNLAFHPSRPSPSSPRNRRLPRSGRGALCVGVYPDRVGALSFPSSFSISSLPLCAHAGTPTTPVPSAIYFITRGHPRVGGIQPRRSSSVNSVPGTCHGSVVALKPTRAVSRVDPLSAKAPKPTLTPLSATLTKNRGEGANTASGPCRVVLPWMTASPFQFLNLSACCELLALSLEGSAVSPVRARVSPLSATFTKNLGEGGTDFNPCKLLSHLDGKVSLQRYRRAEMIRWLPEETCRGAIHCALPRQPSDPMTTHVPVLIVGAGISGLACAYHLRKSGIDAQIVEAASHPGGVMRSERRDGFLLELGPQSFSGTPPLRNLCRDLGIENELIEAPHSAPRFLLINGQLKPAPLSPPAFFASSLFSPKTKFSIVRDLLGRSAPPYVDESVAAFTLRKFSAELLDKLVGPFVSGIYAGDPKKLSLRAAFPQLHEAERSAGSVIRGMIRAAKSKPSPKQRPTLQSFQRRKRNSNQSPHRKSRQRPPLRSRSDSD